MSAPRRDYSKYNVEHQQNVQHEIGSMGVLPTVIVAIIAAYTQDDAKLKRMHDNLMKRLRSCNNGLAAMVIIVGQI